MALLMSVAVTASMPEGDPGTLLQHQRRDCSLILEHSKVLSQEKDIPTLARTRQKLRLVLEEMQREATRLHKDEKLRSHEDYLLSIREGLERLSQLAEEPMTAENLEQFRNMCAFITIVDEEIQESLSARRDKSYRVSR
jgi:hypothetical protein